jgi:capsular polysaccharide biosynthesis protein
MRERTSSISDTMASTGIRAEVDAMVDDDYGVTSPFRAPPVDGPPGGRADVFTTPGVTERPGVDAPAGFLARFWWIVALVTVVAAAASAGVTAATWSTTWDASALVRVGRPGAFAENFTDPAYVERVVRSVATISTEDDVKAATWDRAGVERSGSADPNSLSVEVVRETELLRYHARDSNQSRAEATIAAFVEEAGAAVESVYGDDLAFVAVDVSPEVNEVQPPLALRAALGAAVGLLVGIGGAYLVDRAGVRSFRQRR